MIEELNISEAEYRGLPKPSYSLLKKLDDSGPRSINRKYHMDSDAIDFGSLLDCRLLSREEFHNKFYFESVEKPTGQILELADYIIRTNDDLETIMRDVQLVSEYADELNLFGGVKDQTKRISKFDTDLFWNYLQAKIDAQGKTVFTPDIETEVLEAEVIMRTHPKVAHLFVEQEGIKIMTQLMIVENIRGVEIKGMLDLVRIDSNLKTITPYDLKSTEFRQVNFPAHFRKMKYYLQGGLYKLLLEAFFAELIADGYTIEDFKFIVYSRSDRYPFIWNMGSQWHKDVLNGFYDYKLDYKKGIYQLIAEYQFYVENDMFEIEQCFVINNILEL